MGECPVDGEMPRSVRSRPWAGRKCCERWENNVAKNWIKYVTILCCTHITKNEPIDKRLLCIRGIFVISQVPSIHRGRTSIQMPPSNLRRISSESERRYSFYDSAWRFIWFCLFLCCHSFRVFYLPILEKSCPLQIDCFNPIKKRSLLLPFLLIEKEHNML